MDSTQAPTANNTYAPSLIGGAENMKLLFDDTMAEMSRRRSNATSHDNAWETFRFSIAQDAQLVKHMAQLNIVASAQTGTTENQQTVSPAGTAAGETAKGAVADAGAGIAAANETIADALATAFSFFNQGLAALSSVVVTAAGGASTPSQTTAKS